MKKLLAVSLLCLFIVAGSYNFALCQPQPNENGDGEPVGGQPIDGSAPIGSGLLILLSLGAGYGVKKALKKRDVK